jgi:DUF4097 and DUF4098 domain-containing protein YvlB
MRWFSTILRNWTAWMAALVVSLFAGSCQPSENSTLEEISDRRYPIDPAAATISITNRDGSIQIYGAGDVREIRVETLKKAYTPERLKAIAVEVSAGRNSISINTIYPPDQGSRFSDQSGTVDYVIVVPQRIRISKLDLRNGEVLLEEVHSTRAHAQLGSGRFFVHNCFGNLDITVKTGNLALVYEWWDEADFSIHAKVEDGNSFAYLPEDAVFHLKARTGTGKIANDFEEKEQRRAESTNQVDQLVGGADQPKIEIESQDGNIRIAEHNP